MDGSPMLDYFIFWSIVSLILAIAGGLCLLYLFSLLKDIQQSLSKIESLLASPAAKRKSR